MEGTQVLQKNSERNRAVNYECGAPATLLKGIVGSDMNLIALYGTNP